MVYSWDIPGCGDSNSDSRKRSAEQIRRGALHLFKKGKINQDEATKAMNDAFDYENGLKDDDCPPSPIYKINGK